MLQDRLNELGSATLDIKKDHIYIVGFMNEEMLNAHLENESRNWSSMGLYDKEDINFYDIKDNALIIVRKDGKEINRYQYKPIDKRTVEFKDENGKKISRTFSIRRSVFSDHYHFNFVIENKEKISNKIEQSVLFDNKDELDQFIKEEFDLQL